MANPPLTVIESAGTGMEPPIALGERGRALWNSVRSEYVIAGRGRYRAFGTSLRGGRPGRGVARSD